MKKEYLITEEATPTGYWSVMVCLNDEIEATRGYYSVEEVLADAARFRFHFPKGLIKVRFKSGNIIML